MTTTIDLAEIGGLMDALPPGTDVRYLKDGTWRVESMEHTTGECRTLLDALLQDRAWRWTNGKS